MVSCFECRAALESEPAKTRCERLYEVDKGTLKCEAYGASNLGPVHDLETLNFIVCSPPFPDGTLTPEGLIQLDYSGLSVLRDAASNDEFTLTISQMSERRARELVGVARFTAATVRHDGNARLVGVYDTPLDGKPNHCDLLAPHIAPIKDVLSRRDAESKRKKRIRRLIEKIGPDAIVPAIAFRDGALVASSAV